MVAGHVRCAARHSAHGRREILVERSDRRGGQPTRVRERQRHYRVRLRRQQDVHIQQSGLHGVTTS